MPSTPKPETNEVQTGQAVAPAAICSPLDDDRSDEADYCLEAYEEAANHLETLAEDLEQGLEKNCLLRVAGTIRKTGRLAYGPDLCHDPDAQRANVDLRQRRRQRATERKMSNQISNNDGAHSRASLPQMTCSADVSDFTGYHFSKCGRPAKWTLHGQPRCGLHCSSKWKKANREPIQPNPSLSHEEGVK